MPSARTTSAWRAVSASDCCAAMPSTPARASGAALRHSLNQVNASYFKLTDVFYIQAQEADSKTSDSENPQKASTQSTDIRLIKLGSEVHGPDDEMIISKDQILFFENLKKDGKVSDSITKYNKQQDR